MSDRILGVIFDLDGLILDTETPDSLSWNEIYARYDLDLTGRSMGRRRWAPRSRPVRSATGPWGRRECRTGKPPPPLGSFDGGVLETVPWLP